MARTVDLYFPADARASANEVVLPVAGPQLQRLQEAIRSLGWEPRLLNPEGPVDSVARGIEVIRRAGGERLLVFMAGWTYPDFTVTPLALLPPELPKLLLGSAIPDFPGAVGLLAAASGLEHVGVRSSRLFVGDFDETGEWLDALGRFLEEGSLPPPALETVPVEPGAEDRERARAAVQALRGRLYGAVGPRSMEMWNKISEADFLSVFGVARLGFDGLRLAHMAEAVDRRRAEAAVDWLLEQGMELRLGEDPARDLTRDQVVFQMQVYFALLELKDRFGLHFLGVQDQLDWIEHYPATDLSLGLLNNRLRPEGDGETVVAATEADDGAAVTMELLKLLNGGEPVGFHDLRYWKDGLYWFVNSGALAPYFAQGRHDSLEGAWSERQTPMYFGAGGGTCSVVVRVPGVFTWARFSYRDHRPYLCAGRGLTDIPDEEQWRERSARCSPDWPQHYLRLCGPVEQFLNSNHPMAARGDHLAALRAVAEELGLPFECYDTCTPAELEAKRTAATA